MLAIAIPLILSNSSWSIQSFINRIFLSWHSPVSLAAAMPASMLNYSIMSIFGQTAAYVSTFTAQYHGSGQDSRAGKMIWQAFIIAIIGALINFALIPASPSIFRWIGHDLPVCNAEIDFFRILCLGAFPSVAASAMSGMLSGLGKTRIVMWIALFAVMINIAGDYLLIFGNLGFPALGIAGAGWSSVIAHAFQACAFVCIVLSPSFRRKYGTGDFKPDLTLFKNLIRYGLPSGAQVFIDITAFTIFILLVGRLGMDQLAATNVAININMLAFLPMIGLGIAVSVLVGQALGRDDAALAKYSVKSAFTLTIVYMILVALLFLIFPGVFLAPFRPDNDPAAYERISKISVILLRFVAVYTLFDAFNIIFSSAIKGAGDTKFVMYMILCLSLSVMVIPIYLSVTWLNASVYVCWTFLSLYAIVLGISFYLRYRKGKWQNMRVISIRKTAV